MILWGRPATLGAQCFGESLHKLSVNVCVYVCVFLRMYYRHVPKLATLFAPMCVCSGLILNPRGPLGARMCVKACIKPLVFLRPEQAVAKQIPSCLR